MVFNRCKMAGKLDIDGTEYPISSLSDLGKSLLVNIQAVDIRLKQKLNDRSLLLRARNAYISDLKEEVILEKSGIDLTTIFDDD